MATLASLEMAHHPLRTLPRKRSVITSNSRIRTCDVSRILIANSQRKDLLESKTAVNRECIVCAPRHYKSIPKIVLLLSIIFIDKAAAGLASAPVSTRGHGSHNQRMIDRRGPMPSCAGSRTDIYKTLPLRRNQAWRKWFAGTYPVLSVDSSILFMAAFTRTQTGPGAAGIENVALNFT